MNTRSITFAALTCALFLQVTSVSAADLYVVDADPEPFAPDEVIPYIGYDWDRFYGGVFVGYMQADLDISNDFGVDFFSTSVDVSSGMVGLTIGKNFQRDNDRFVLGIEADIAGIDLSASDSRIVGLVVDGDSEYAVELDLFATLRGRIGVPMGEEGKILPYFTAGLAAAHADVSARNSSTSPLNSNSGWMMGYAIGGGVEAALTERLTFKTEYLFSDMTKGLDLNVGGPPPLGTASFDLSSIHQIRVGLNIHF